MDICTVKLNFSFDFVVFDQKMLFSNIFDHVRLTYTVKCTPTG